MRCQVSGYVPRFPLDYFVSRAPYLEFQFRFDTRGSTPFEFVWVTRAVIAKWKIDSLRDDVRVTRDEQRGSVTMYGTRGFKKRRRVVQGDCIFTLAISQRRVIYSFP